VTPRLENAAGERRGGQERHDVKTACFALESVVPLGAWGLNRSVYRLQDGCHYKWGEEAKTELNVPKMINGGKRFTKCGKTDEKRISSPEKHLVGVLMHGEDARYPKANPGKRGEENPHSNVRQIQTSELSW